MATDIFDTELKAMRELRWQNAFGVRELELSETVKDTEDSNRRATIALEHLIQAADVAHTMQHWMVYQKWNKRLFQETYDAFQSGRCPTNHPADGWYKGELWLFDNYIIPLARKLRECRVFGVSCDEFLDCALDNRTEWEAKGENFVSELVKKMESTRVHAEDPSPSSMIEDEI